jgi:hypothetical protein
MAGEVIGKSVKLPLKIEQEGYYGYFYNDQLVREIG